MSKTNTTANDGYTHGIRYCSRYNGPNVDATVSACHAFDFKILQYESGIFIVTEILRLYVRFSGYGDLQTFSCGGNRSLPLLYS